MRMIRRLASVVAAALVAVLFVAPAPASAASGGGCSIDYTFSFGYFSACISSPSHGMARADAYTTFYNSVSPCRMEVRIRNTSYNIVAYLSMSCYTTRPGATGGVYYVASSGSYLPELYINRNGSVSTITGPWITLP